MFRFVASKDRGTYIYQRHYVIRWIRTYAENLPRRIYRGEFTEDNLPNHEDVPGTAGRRAEQFY